MYQKIVEIRKIMQKTDDSQENFPQTHSHVIRHFL